MERRRLPSSIAVASAYTQLGIFVGPALAGWVILNFGTAAAFASNVIGYGVFFWSAALLRTPPDYVPPAPSGKAYVRDFMDTPLALLVWIATARARKRTAAAFALAGASGVGNLSSLR